MSWKWAAAAYTALPYLGTAPASVDYAAMSVKPVDDNHTSVYNNSHHAVTPEGTLPSGTLIISKVRGGATGGGGSNYTGGLSGTATLTPEAVDALFALLLENLADL